VYLIKRIKKLNIQKKLTMFLIISGLTAACSPTVTSQSSPSPAASANTPVKLGEIPIQPDRDFYVPSMSSTVGIGLTPMYTLGRSPDSVKFTWHTNYGRFLNWNAPDFKVGELGKDTEFTDKKIYWSYSPDDMGKDKPDVLITLEVSDKTSGNVLTKSSLNIVWENKDTAKVKK
jgi:hypothetical protein